MEYFAAYGLAGLFIAAFLAATLLPLSSEALLILQISATGDMLYPVLVASAGNILGSFLNYYIGYKGDRFVFKRIFKFDKVSTEKARKRFKKYGQYSLLFAWVPVIGDPLTVVAGIFRINLWLFGFIVSLGKIGRYVILAYGYSLF